MNANTDRETIARVRQLEKSRRAQVERVITRFGVEAALVEHDPSYIKGRRWCKRFKKRYEYHRQRHDTAMRVMENYGIDTSGMTRFEP